jgi:peptidoglycan/xylan/chitin deacetylase (PgdA/CDA1 family)
MPLRAQAKDLVRPLADRVLGSIYGARTDEPLVSFTFDDGPDERETPRLLDALAEHGARGTFFLLGERARRYPELVRTIRSAGHEVGSHSELHRRLTGIPLREVARDMRRGKQTLETILGEQVRLFRPPYGFLTRGGYVIARGLSLDVVAWSADAEDWLERPVEELVATAFERLARGGILLLHERHEPPPPKGPTFDRELLLRSLLAGIDRRGWRSVPVSELVESRPIERKLWFRLPAPSGQELGQGPSTAGL